MPSKAPTSTTTNMDTSSPPASPSASVIVGALKGLTQSTQALLKHHIALARHEAKADALEVGKDITGLIIAGVFAGIGYVFLLMSAVLFSSWFAGMVGMALTCFAIALIHLVGGGLIAARMAKHFQTRHYGPVQTRREVKETVAWVKESIRSSDEGGEEDAPAQFPPPRQTRHLEAPEQ